MGGTILVNGVSWIRNGATFISEHQRMRDHVQTSDSAARQGLESTELKDALQQLTRLSWLQTNSSKGGLYAVASSAVGSRSRKRREIHITPYCMCSMMGIKLTTLALTSAQ